MRRVALYHGEVIPLHIGDTHLAPPDQSRLGSLGFPTGPSPDLYRYSPPPGKQELLDAVVGKLAARNRFAAADANHVQITAGATHALSCAVRSVLDAGDHLLLLAPYWPLIRGIAVASGVRPVDVPFSTTSCDARGFPPTRSSRSTSRRTPPASTSAPRTTRTARC